VGHDGGKESKKDDVQLAFSFGVTVLVECGLTVDSTEARLYRYLTPNATHKNSEHAVSTVI
jgi:hypothetical protein